MVEKMESLIRQPNDIYNAVFPLYIFSKLVCLTPIEQKQQSDGKLQYEFSWKNILLVAIETSLYIALTVFAHFKMESYIYDFGNKLQFIEGALSGVLAVVEIFFGCIFAKKLIQVYDGINETELILKTLMPTLSYR